MNWLRLLILSLVLTMTLSACGSGANDSGSNHSGGDNSGDDGSGGGDDSNTANSCEPADSDGIVSCKIDATSYTDFVYFDFETGEAVELSEAQATGSDAWDIALRRFSIKTNGGSSSDGTGQAATALVVAQDDFYNTDGEPNSSVFMNASPESEHEHLVDDHGIPDNWTADKVVSTLAPEPVEDASGCTPISPPAYRIDYGWYRYNGGCLEGGPHTLAANPDNGWLLRSGEGNSYARFRAASMSFSSTDGLTATFEFLVQLAGTSGFSEARSWGLSNAGNGEYCYDFDLGAELTDCMGGAWDIRLSIADRDIALASNSGPNGSGGAGAFGPLPWADITAYDNGTSGPSGEPLATLYQADASSSLIDLETWHAYDLGGNHQLWPNYRVWMINADTADSASALFALQITSYYDGTGESGHINFRYRPVARP